MRFLLVYIVLPFLLTVIFVGGIVGMVTTPREVATGWPLVCEDATAVKLCEIRKNVALWKICVGGQSYMVTDSFGGQSICYMPPVTSREEVKQ